MKKVPKKKRKVTELYFNEYDSTAEIYTYKKLTKIMQSLSKMWRMNISSPSTIP